jgi:hypothetical protein
MTTIEKRHLHLLACSFCSLVPPGKLHEKHPALASEALGLRKFKEQ